MVDENWLSEALNSAVVHTDVVTVDRLHALLKGWADGFAKKRNQDFQFYATVLFIREQLLK